MMLLGEPLGAGGALDPALLAHDKRVLNTVGLVRFERAVDEGSRVMRLLWPPG